MHRREVEQRIGMQSDLIECGARSCEPDVFRRPPQSVIWPIFRVCWKEKRENEDINHFVRDELRRWIFMTQIFILSIASEMPSRWITMKIYLVEFIVERGKNVEMPNIFLPQQLLGEKKKTGLIWPWKAIFIRARRSVYKVSNKIFHGIFAWIIKRCVREKPCDKNRRMKMFLFERNVLRGSDRMEKSLIFVWRNSMTVDVFLLARRFTYWHW